MGIFSSLRNVIDNSANAVGNVANAVGSGAQLIERAASHALTEQIKDHAIDALDADDARIKEFAANVAKRAAQHAQYINGEFSGVYKTAHEQAQEALAALKKN